MARTNTGNYRPELVYPCAGPCGRDTRPSSWYSNDLPEEYQDTIVRATKTMCATCYNRTPEAQERRAKPKVEAVLTEKDYENIRQAEAFARARQARLARKGAVSRLRTARPVMAGRG